MNKKFILFMTSLSLAVAPMSVFASEYTGPAASVEAVEERANLQAATGEYRSWKQYDTRWASQRLGSSADTMSESGCLVVAIASLMVHSGCADENGVDPGKLCTYLSNNGGFTSNGELYWDKVSGAVDGFRLANWSVALSGSRYDKVAQIKSYLDNGYYLVVSVGYGAHWVAVDSVDGNGNVNIFDPAYSYTKLFGSYSDAGITRIAVFSGNGSGNGNIDVPSNNNNSTMENYNATGKVNVGASYLNVRQGVGTDQGYMTDSAGNRITLQNNETVTITGKGKDSSGNLWYRVAINGLTGYVYGAYVEIVTNNTNNNNNNTAPSEEKPAKVNASYVNIRSGAGTNYSVVSVASQNEEITVLGEEKDSSGATWYKIKYNNTTGYMHSDYVTLEQTNNNNNNNNTSNYPEKSAKVNASSVNVRSGAGTNNGVVATLALNTSLTVVGEEKDGSGATWYKIKYDGGEGYMHSDYVTISDNNTNNNNNNGGTTTPSRTGSVNADYVNVRTGAGTDNSRVTSLNSGTAVTIVGEEKDGSGATWYKINYAGGSGYMHSDYITVNGDNNNNANNNNNNNGGYEKKDGTVNASSVNVRNGAGTSNSIVGNLSSGKNVTIVGEEKDSSGAVWYKIEYDGGSGYMHSDYITVGSGNNGNNNNGGGSGDYPMEGIEGKEGVVNASLVYVRAGAGSDQEVMNTLKSGVSVLIEGAERDSSGVIWYKVAFAGTSGYMMAEFVSIQ